mgnify:CR=1 FL=1
MNMTDYISNDFKPLTTPNTVNEALKLFETHLITHIPVLENNHFIGCISQTDVLSIDNRAISLKELQSIFEYFKTEFNESILDTLKVFAEYNSNITPILINNNYFGYLELSDVLDELNQTPFLNSEGFILVVEKNIDDYTMSEIAQIIESNNGIILGVYESKRDTEKVQATLKISSQEINDIIQTFRRYNYTVISELKDDMYLEELKDRSDYLQKFLNT